MNDPNEHRAVRQHQTRHQARHWPIYQSSEQQALETFKHAAEQRRLLRRERWTITNYALIAYTALAAAPDWLGTKSWLVPFSVCTLVLVWGAAVQAYRLLADLQDAEDMELDRMHAAQSHLRLIWQIHKDNPHYVDQAPRKTFMRKHRRWWEMPPPRRWISFALILGLGAIIASTIINSRVPYRVLWYFTGGMAVLVVAPILWRIPHVQEVVASIGRSAPPDARPVQTGRAHEPRGDRTWPEGRGARELMGEGAMTDDVGPWIVGGVMALVALLGLGLASGAQDDVIYGTGLGLFIFGVLFIFFLIHRNSDASRSARRRLGPDVGL